LTTRAWEAPQPHGPPLPLIVHKVSAKHASRAGRNADPVVQAYLVACGDPRDSKLERRCLGWTGELLHDETPDSQRRLPFERRRMWGVTPRLDHMATRIVRDMDRVCAVAMKNSLPKARLGSSLATGFGRRRKRPRHDDTRCTLSASTTRQGWTPQFDRSSPNRLRPWTEKNPSSADDRAPLTHELLVVLGHEGRRVSDARRPSVKTSFRGGSYGSPVGSNRKVRSRHPLHPALPTIRESPSSVVGRPPPPPPPRAEA
jgi:hypothetical protein